MKVHLFSVLIGAVAAAVLLWAFTPIKTDGSRLSSAPESAYERVMRTGQLTCGIMPWAPYWMVDVNTGAITGMAKDFFDGLATLAHLKIRYVPITFGTQPLELATGRVDAICNDGPWILSSAKALAYTTPPDSQLLRVRAKL